MHFSILHKKYLDTISDDIFFHEEILEKKIKTQVYFDTAGVIDLLLGIEGLIKGQKIHWGWFYKRPEVLVHGLAYNGWLGKIYCLPPHTEEIIDKIQYNSELFKNKYDEFYELLYQDFWSKADPKVLKLQSEKPTRKWIKTLKSDSVDLFKRVFLSSHKGFWKNRYKYLVKDQQTLCFTSELDYQFGDVQQSDFFKKLYHYLNSKREKSSNNYIDAIALALLDKRVKKINFSEDKSLFELPVFFSNQDHILEAVRHFSKIEYEEGLFHFTFNGDSGRYPVVRNANFFIINGVFNAVQSNQSADAIQRFSNTLENILEIRKMNVVQGDRGDTQFSKIENKFKKHSDDRLFLEFFNSWWENDGYDQFLKAYHEDFISAKKADADDAVYNYIEEQRKELKDKFTLYKGRIGMIKKIWNEIGRIGNVLNGQYVREDMQLDVFKVFSPRFSFTEAVCNDIQILFDRIIQAHRSKDKFEMDSCKSEIVTSIVIGLYEKEEGGKHPLCHLAKGIGVLWLAKKYDLIAKICSTSRAQYTSKNSTTDLYPSASIALMHSAAIFLGKSSNISKALDILKCVESKFGLAQDDSAIINKPRYKVWIGLSYAYYLIWSKYAETFDIPEELPAEVLSKQYYIYLGKTLKYAEGAVDWLKERKQNIEEENKLKYRNRKYYYALSVVIFAMTMMAPRERFKKLLPLVRKLELMRDDKDVWQADHFADTISRYFHRMAVLAEDEPKFEKYLKDAILYNQEAIKHSMEQKGRYKILKENLEALASKGFSELQVERQ